MPVRLLPEHLIANGEPTATTHRLSELAGLEPRSLHAGLSRLRRQGRLFSPARGFYVAVPAEYRAWGAVPASWWIDPMMSHLGRSYYVGLLSAAAVHGAAHQAPQTFQVMVNDQLADRQRERIRVEFHVSSTLEQLPQRAIERSTTPTGTMAVSSRELTAVDLVEHPDLSGGLDNVATVLIDLFESDTPDVELLAQVATTYPRSVVRRLGWLLDEMVDVPNLEPLRRLAAPETGNATPLDVHTSREGERDPTWSVLVNTAVEPDV